MLVSVDQIIADTIGKASTDLRALSLAIHDHPETALKEAKASKAICDYLAQRGFQITRQAGSLPTAFVSTYTSPKGAHNGLYIGFCAEFDALPGIGHGCGHNLIAISGVAMFLALAAVMEACGLPGTVKLYGTPAEEAIGGKIIMLKEGVFQGCDLLMMLHPASGYTGQWHSQCCVSVTVEYFGKASHAAMAPWDGINAGSAATIALQSMGVLREQLRPDWRTHGIITHGGQAANVIPAYSRIEYTYRTGWEEDIEVLRERVYNVFASAALATGCTHKITEEFAYLDNLDNPVLGRLYEDLMQEEYRVPPVKGDGLGGSTDFGNLSKEFISLHGMFDLDGSGVPNHTLEFAERARSEIAHERVLFAAKSCAKVAAKCLVDAEFWSKVKKAKRATRNQIKHN
ncbi:hypothetical protein LPJ66_005270 [Kickxella alabastrina]|uniref:Uncharacterized protein n=1 Tax=Kickxella alabastrina TaxID=61397 RepID=A0ACC1IGE0_9FUNG|nr:hypothetical protein LPJ66_005270 [Kickxella alabastrina]